MATVTVACKMPTGLKLEIFEFEEVMEPLLGGGHKAVKRSKRVGEPVYIRGWNADHRAAFGSTAVPAAPGAFALTHGVDASFWETWRTQHADADIVKNGLIFASEKQDTIDRRVANSDKIKSGLEPINPKSPPMVGIRPADEMKARLDKLDV